MEDVLPFVSICTPTFNRRPFIPLLKKCIEEQTYPLSKIEWIIADDGTDPIEDLITDISYCKYFRVEKMPLGKKRNFIHSKCSGSIIVNIDDDDFYPPNRVEHAVDTILKNNVLIVGSSKMFMYFFNKDKVYQCGPYKDNHCTAATMAFKKELLNVTSYPEDAYVAEETKFLKGYSIPMIQLDPFKTILVFSHKHNSYDKDEMLNSLKQTDLTVSDFIKNDELENLYMTEIPKQLDIYDNFGSSKNKTELSNYINTLKKQRFESKKQKIIEMIDSGDLSIDDFITFMEKKKYYELNIENKNKMIKKLIEKIKGLEAKK